MSENTKIKVYGIDLGTTYSAISHVGDSGNVEIINNPDGGSITASAVFFEDGRYCRRGRCQGIRLYRSG